MLIREPSVAGQFYPANADALRREIAGFQIKPSSLLKAKAVLVPHAGYIYSGEVAGKVFSSIELPHRIVMLGPNHTGMGVPLALAPEDAWRTPMGVAMSDAEFNRLLKKECPELKEDASAHRREHALEVQLPFIQTLQPQFQFSAVCVGTDEYSVLETLGHALARAAQTIGGSTLLIASSDMTHYESAEAAARQDRWAIDQILELNPEGLYRTVLENSISMCGFAPAVAVLIACRDLGATAGQLIDYTNSGEASGDYGQVVAYAGIAIA
jgi:MEMO1 family protein